MCDRKEVQMRYTQKEGLPEKIDGEMAYRVLQSLENLIDEGKVDYVHKGEEDEHTDEPVRATFFR